MKYTATCMKAACRYSESYDRHPGAAPKCPKCGSPMMPKAVK